MVGVEVGDDGDIGAPGVGRRERTPASAQVCEPACEQRVGEDAHVRVLDRAGGVTPPGDLHRHFFASFARLPEAYGLE